MPDVPQWSYPMRLGVNGDFAEVEQDTLDDVRQSVYLLTRTPVGVRPLAPDIGLEDPTFTIVDLDALAATLEEQEDRAVVSVTVESLDDAGEQVLQIDVALVSEPEEDSTS